MNFKLIFKNNFGYILIITIAVIIGFYFRLKGLAKWPLALDEYYIVKSAENILKYGLPEWVNGGYYLRGLLYQYLIAGLLSLGIKAEFAARIIPVILNLIAIPPLFILSKKLSGKFFATIISLVFIFSVWEVEISRFARMYVPFQTIFIWYILFLYKYLVEDHKSSLKWTFILSFTSILIYEGSIFLIILNFIPFFWNQETRKFDINILIKREFNFGYAIITFLIFIFAYYLNVADTRNMASGEVYPPDYLTSHSYVFEHNMFYKPQLLLTTLFQNSIWLFPFAIVLCILFYSFFTVIKSKRNWFNKSLIALILLLSLLNLFGLIILLLLLFIWIDWFCLKDRREKEIKWVITAIVINLIFWSAFAFFTSSWYSFFTDFESHTKSAIVKKIFLLLFNYPNIYFEFYRYAITLPFLTLIFIASVATVLFKIMKSNYYESLGIRLIAFILFLLITIFLFIDTRLSETRYTFFLYPLVLITIFTSLSLISKAILKEGLKERIAFIIFSLLFLIVSGDFSLRHLTKIDSKEINFRMIYNSNMVRHYYPRWDVRTPAEIVNKEKQVNDVTIIDELNTEYYLDTLDYLYQHYDHTRFSIISVEGGKKERWTNSKLIYTNHDLLNVFKETKGYVWFISIDKPYLEFENFAFKERFSKYKYFTSVDGNIHIYKIPGGKGIYQFPNIYLKKYD